jgi:hypothetical protein
MPCQAMPGQRRHRSSKVFFGWWCLLIQATGKIESLRRERSRKGIRRCWLLLLGSKQASKQGPGWGGAGRGETMQDKARPGNVLNRPLHAYTTIPPPAVAAALLAKLLKVEETAPSVSRLTSTFPCALSSRIVLPRDPFAQTTALRPKPTPNITVTVSPTAQRSLRAHHIAEQQLEPIRQPTHVWVLLAAQLEASRDDFDAPILQPRFLTCFENQVKIARSLAVDAELVHTAFGICGCVGLEPVF